MPTRKFDKERAKFWTNVLLGIVAIYGATQSTMLLGDGSKNKEDVGALVKQLNEVVLPQIQKELDLLRADNIVLHERLATLSLYNELLRDIQKEMKLSVTGGKGKEHREAQAAAALKLAPPAELFEKRALVKIDLTQKDMGY